MKSDFQYKITTFQNWPIKHSSLPFPSHASHATIATLLLLVEVESIPKCHEHQQLTPMIIVCLRNEFLVRHGYKQFEMMLKLNEMKETNVVNRKILGKIHNTNNM
jgi:hypothetical protein